MPSPESFPSGNHEQEQNREISEETYRRWGKISYEQVRSELEEREALRARQDAIEAEIARRAAARAAAETPAATPAEAPAAEAPEAPVVPATPEAAPVAETAEQAPTPEEIEQAKNKAKKNKGFKRFLTGALAAIIALGISTGIFLNHNQPNEQPNDDTIQTEFVGEQEHIGIYDGYGEEGMWLSESKRGQYNFADAGEVAEACDYDECEMIKYAAENQSESMADYLANLPEELQPEGFKGLTILEAEAKLESLSDEEYEELQKQFNAIIDDAFTRDVTLNGRYDNAYMRLKDPNGPVTHDNMELVHCETNENGTGATDFYWLDEDGNEIGHMTVKLARNFNEKGEAEFEGCLQVVDPDHPEK